MSFATDHDQDVGAPAPDGSGVRASPSGRESVAPNCGAAADPNAAPLEPASWRERLQQKLDGPRCMVALAVLAFAAIVLAQHRYVPTWDAASYSDCVQTAVSHPGRFESLSCALRIPAFARNTHGYVLVLSLSQLLAPGSFAAILVINTLLGIGAILAFYAVVRAAFPAPNYRWDCSLLTSAWALHPVFLSSAVFVNAEYGLLVFTLIALACLLRGWITAASIAGLLAVFSKDVGVLAYGIVVGAYWLTLVGRSSAAPKEKLFRSVRLLPAIVPVLLFGLYVALRPRGTPPGAAVPQGYIWGNAAIFSLASPWAKACLAGIVDGDDYRRTQAHPWAAREADSAAPLACSLSGNDEHDRPLLQRAPQHHLRRSGRRAGRAQELGQ